HRQDEKLVLTFEPAHALEQGRALGLHSSKVGASELTTLLDVPVDVFVKLAAVLRDEIAISQFCRPVPPCQETFISVAEIRLLVFDYASQRLEDFALCLHGGLDLRIPGQPQVLEHRDPHSLEASPAKRLRKLAARLVNRYRRVVVKSS